jgi:PAS domain S-box-containing protein
MVGLVGLANKEGGFHEALIGFFQPLYASIAAIIGAVRIDAARMQAEASLRQSEFEMRSTFEMAAVGMAHLGADGRFLRVNSQLADSLGLQEAALVGHTLAQFTHPDDREGLCQQFEQLVAGDVPRLSMQLRGLHAAGDDLLLWLCATQVCDATGKSGFVVAVIEDITARKRAETAMLAAQAAERANMAKTQFLSHMSHELRTPLNSVVGFSQLLQLDRSPPLSANQQAHARQIESAGSHLLAMINDLLDLSRIESGTVSMSLESVDVRQSIDEAISLVSKTAADAGLRVDVLLPEGVMAERVEADRVRLRQVLVNLLSNAIKYNRAGGSVSVLLNPGTQDDELAIEVKDTGHGMSVEQMGHLFEPFNRLGAERSHIEGTGIGLMITRGLVELMGGQLQVTSEVGVGSSFTVVLKLPAGHTRLRVEPGSSATDGPTAGAGAKLSVLYAEDNPTNVMLMKAVMELRPQWRLVCAMSGREALEVALSDPPDLVLLDLHLGDMTGLELLQQMRTHASLAALPSMVLSADALPESQRQAAQAGVLEYLTKPIDVPRFLAAMDAVERGL